MKRVFLTNTIPIKFNFIQTEDSFIVDEILNYKLSKRGRYRLLKIKKRNKSTIELINYIAEVLRIEPKEFGYAGLKDKNATTTQYITLPKYINFKRFKNSRDVEIDEVGFVEDRLRIGGLIGNRFTIKLSDVDSGTILDLKEALKRIEGFGFANFFGYQRFGKLNDSIKKGEFISKFGKRAKSQEAKILLASYQAKMFNEWLNRRVEISKEILEGVNSLKLSPSLFKVIKESKPLYKIVPKDIMVRFKKGRKELFYLQDIKRESSDFFSKRVYPTGVLYGKSVKLSASIAGDIERKFIDYDFNALRGARRAAWVYPKDLRFEYDEKSKEVTLEFSLPAGSYATVLIEELANRVLFI
jgi:tRNA pseudouridine13 synthase